MSHATTLERAIHWVSCKAQQRVPYDAANNYLEGPFAPVHTEVTETDLTVTGTLPHELNGLYVRIGPNPIDVPNPALYHWFLGPGMVHGVRLRDGKALWYRNRWIGTDSVQRRLGRPEAPGPRRGSMDVVNTNIIGHAGHLWALVEGMALPVELDGELNTLRHGLFAERTKRSFSAHPRLDPATGELHAICYDVMIRNRVDYVVIGADGRLLREVRVPVRHGPMIHDSAMTRSSVVILDLPVTFSMGAVLRGRPLPYTWNTRHPARVGLLPRTGDADAVRWFEIEPCFAFHIVNAYDADDGSTVVDVVAYPRIFEKQRKGLQGGHGRMERWTLDPARAQVKRSVISEFRQEFPRCDDRLAGRPYRYAYSIGVAFDAIGPQPLYRHDLWTGAIDRHDYGPSHMPAEAVFVPRHANAAEDDGWLLAFVYDLSDDSSTLVVLDASDPSGEAVATVWLPARVPLGFHGNWIADAA
ncbi:MAG: carotenoid oxygenase family protein [Rhodopila sp.]